MLRRDYSRWWDAEPEDSPNKAIARRKRVDAYAAWVERADLEMRKAAFEKREDCQHGLTKFSRTPLHDQDADECGDLPCLEADAILRRLRVSRPPWEQRAR